MSNLVKQYFVLRDEKSDSPVVINSNKRMEEHFKQLAIIRREEEERIAREAQEEELRRQAEFVEGIPVTNIDGEAVGEMQEGMDPVPVIPAGPSYEEIVTEAREEADRILSEASAQAEQILADATVRGQVVFEEQKTLGYEAGEAMVAEEIERAKREMNEQLEVHTQALQSEYEEKLSHMEQDITDAIIQVFDRVFHIQFEDQKDILMYLITDTMLGIHGDKKFKIFTTADQISFLEEHMDSLKEKLGADVELELMYDGNIAPGGCRIETDHGVFDCGIDTQLSNIYKSIRALSE